MPLTLLCLDQSTAGVSKCIYIDYLVVPLCPHCPAETTRHGAPAPALAPQRLLLPVDPFGKIGMDVEELPNYQAGASN